MRIPKNSFWTLPNPKNSPLVPQKVKKDHKIKTKSKVGIEEIIENENCLTICVQPTTVFEPYPDTKNSPLGPQTVKDSPKIKSNSKVRIEGSIENETRSIILVDPKTFLNSNQPPK